MTVFAYRHQPLRTIYVVLNVLAVLVRLPYWTLRNLLPAWRPRRSWSLGRSVLVQVLRVYVDVLWNAGIAPETPPEVHAQYATELGFVWVDATPELVRGEVRDMAEINNVKAERTCGFWWGPRGPDGIAGQKAAPGEKVLYYLHGGAYVMQTSHPDSPILKTMLPDFLKHFGPDLRTFALEYRLSSAAPFTAANPFPAALLDAIAGYRYLVEDVKFAPENIIISGDSAGGNLAVSLALHIEAIKGPRLPKAAGLLLISPTVDWALTHTGPGSSMERNRRSDFIARIMTSGYSRRALLGNLSEDAAATSIWISPGSLRLRKPPGAFSGLPKTCIVADEAEVTLDPMCQLRDYMRDDMGASAVTYVEIQDATHDCFTASWHEPERTNGLREVAKWVQGVWEGREPEALDILA